MIKRRVTTEKEGTKIIKNAQNYPGVIMPGTPYGTHYLLEAMFNSGMEK